MRPINIKRQSGAVLVVALVMLLLLTLIGIASMRGTALQENMSGNLRDSHLALQAAEASVRRGEAVLFDKFLNNTLSTLDFAAQTGTYANFSGVNAPPTYRITLLAKLRTSTETGVPVDGEGATARVEGFGYGATANNNGTSAASSTLRSVYLVEQ